MSSLCQVRADTNLGIEKFYFSIFVPLFEIVLRSGCCGGGALFNPILTGYKSTPRLSIEKRARAYCLPVVRARAAPTRCTKAVQRAVSVLPCQSERALRLRSAACQGTPSMLRRLSGHPVHALPPVRASRPRPHGTKCCFVGKYATKTGIWAMKRIKSRRKMGTNEREIKLGRVRKESERHG